MRNDATVDTASDSGKAIKIQLTSEGLVLALIKVNGEHSSDELLVVVDFESLSSLDPRDNVVVVVPLGTFQHQVELEGEAVFLLQFIFTVAFRVAFHLFLRFFLDRLILLVHRKGVTVRCAGLVVRVLSWVGGIMVEHVYKAIEVFGVKLEVQVLSIDTKVTGNGTIQRSIAGVLNGALVALGMEKVIESTNLLFLTMWTTLRTLAVVTLRTLAVVMVAVMGHGRRHDNFFALKDKSERIMLIDGKILPVSRVAQVFGSSARNAVAEFGLSSYKEFVDVASLVGAVVDLETGEGQSSCEGGATQNANCSFFLSRKDFAYLLPAVNVQLSLKGLEFGLGKVALHDLVGKDFGLVNLERLSTCLPVNDMVESAAFGVLQHRIELAGERQSADVVVRFAREHHIAWMGFGSDDVGSCEIRNFRLCAKTNPVPKL